MVNGKKVNIPNIDLFEAAFEGMALKKQTTSIIEVPFNGDSEVARVAVEEAYKFIKSLPFPLYCIELDIKYAMMGHYISCRISDIMHQDINCWVNRGLCIRLSDDEHLKIVGRTWSMCKTDKMEDQSDIIIGEYEKEPGYEEFSWCLMQMLDGLRLDNFYKKCMPEFERACLGEAMVMKWELGKMLEFGYVPNNAELAENQVVDYNTGKRYEVEVYWTGKMKNSQDNKSKMVCNISGLPNVMRGMQKLDEKDYSFNVYEIGTTEGRRKNTKLRVPFMCVYKAIVEYGAGTDEVEKVKYRAITDGSMIAIDIAKNIYVGKLGATKLKLIGRNLDMIGMENGRVYIAKERTKESGVNEIRKYAYDIKGTLLLCSIEFYK